MRAASAGNARCSAGVESTMRAIPVPASRSSSAHQRSSGQRLVAWRAPGQSAMRWEALAELAPTETSSVVARAAQSSAAAGTLTRGSPWGTTPIGASASA